MAAEAKKGAQEAKKTEGKEPAADKAAADKPAADKPAGDKAAKPDEELSMEEILQSIRRIIAEDDKDGKKEETKEEKVEEKVEKKAEEKKENKKEEPKAAAPAAPAPKPTVAKPAEDEDVTGSDVLELTDMVKDDGTVVNVKEEAAKEAAGKDVLNKIDEALTTEQKATPPKPAEEPKPEPKVEAKPEVKAEPPPLVAETKPAPVKAPEPPAEEPSIADSLMSDAAAAASAAAFNKLKAMEQYVPPAPVTAAPAFRDGTTMEDLVTEMLRPMMKQWLDANLPQMVERIVEREIRKLTK